ncbi:MAG: MinD/ParA family protein [Fimbriimonadia bacterium]|jgi:flagellar biosynthesis protein FlhG
MRTIAVTSGKGGVGKTNLSANLGLALASLQKRVVIFDADLGLANLDIVLGTRAAFNLQNVVSGEKRLLDVVATGPGGVRYIAGGSGVETLVNLSGPQLESFLMGLEELQSSTDYLIFDTGAGVDAHVMMFLEAADETLLVATPDPASLTDAYATAKVLYGRKPDAVVRLVVNMAEDDAQASALYVKLQSIVKQFLGKSLQYAGAIRHDPKAIQYIRQRKPFLLADRGLQASRGVLTIASVIAGQAIEQEQGGIVNRLRSVFGLERRTA